MANLTCVGLAPGNACLVDDEEMHVVLSHDLEPDFGGINDPANWIEGGAFAMAAEPSVMVVESFDYWQENGTMLPLFCLNRVHYYIPTRYC